MIHVTCKSEMKEEVVCTLYLSNLLYQTKESNFPHDQCGRYKTGKKKGTSNREWYTFCPTGRRSRKLNHTDCWLLALSTLARTLGYPLCQGQSSLGNSLVAKSVGEVLAIISSEALVLKAGTAHGDGDWAASLGRVAGEDRSKVHAGRRDVVDIDGCDSSVSNSVHNQMIGEVRDSTYLLRRHQSG